MALFWAVPRKMSERRVIGPKKHAQEFLSLRSILPPHIFCTATDVWLATTGPASWKTGAGGGFPILGETACARCSGGPQRKSETTGLPFTMGLIYGSRPGCFHSFSHDGFEKVSTCQIAKVPFLGKWPGRLDLGPNPPDDPQHRHHTALAAVAPNMF